MEFLIYMCAIGVCGAERLCRQERLALPRWCTSLPAPKTSSAKAADGNFSVEAFSLLFMKRKPLPNPSVQFLKLFYSWTIFGKDIKIAPILFQKSAQQAALLQLSIERNGPLYAFSLYRSWYRVSFVQFFHCVPPSVGLAGRKERSNLCNSLA